MNKEKKNNKFLFIFFLLHIFYYIPFLYFLHFLSWAQLSPHGLAKQHACASASELIHLHSVKGLLIVITEEEETT